jgi:ankyrin repeat protein
MLQDKSGWTALTFAATYHPEAVAPMLAGLGSKQKTELFMLQNKSGWTALTNAAKNNPMAVKPILAGLGSKKNRTAHVAK